MASLPSSMLDLGGQWYLMGLFGQWRLLELSTAPPPIMWSFLRVMTTTRRCKVFSSNVTLGIPFHSHLMRSGSAIRVMATWHILTSGCLCLVWGAFGFPAGFQFPRLGFFKNSLLSSLPSHFLSFLHLFLSSPIFVVSFFWAWMSKLRSF